jgi:hypothetical protein
LQGGRRKRPLLTLLEDDMKHIEIDQAYNKQYAPVRPKDIAALRPPMLRRWDTMAGFARSEDYLELPISNSNKKFNRALSSVK